MSVASFHTFITADKHLKSLGTCVRQANLLTQGRQLLLEEQGGSAVAAGSLDPRTAPSALPRVAFVVDAEGCLDRLYGGYFSDWSCGGQWAHMLDFIATLISTLHRHNVQLAFFFNGALEPERFLTWRQAQLQLKSNVAQVMRHISKRATPPPKAWWVPPCSLRTMLRLALKSLNCSVVSYPTPIMIIL